MESTTQQTATLAMRQAPHIEGPGSFAPAFALMDRFDAHLAAFALAAREEANV